VDYFLHSNRAEQIGRERGERVSDHNWSGDGFVNSRRRVNSVRLLLVEMQMAKRISLYAGVGLITFLLSLSVVKLSLRHAPADPWQVLLSFQNQDLNKLPDEQKHALQTAIDRIIGPPNPNEFPFSPRLFQVITNTTGQTRYVLVREQPLLSIPGDPRVRIHVFDNFGRLLTGDEFSGGWRTFVTAVSVAKNDLLRQDALIVDGRYWTGKHTSRQYYVLVNDRMVPAYFDHDGKLQRADYLFGNSSIAPSIP